MLVHVVLCAGLFPLAQEKPPEAPPDPLRHYMLVFGYERTPLQPGLTHTFATFVKAQGTGENGNILETHTISWMPDDLELRRLRLKPQRGVNLDLESTLRLARSLQTAVAMWGPYEIHAELHERAVQQVARLKDGTIGYKLLDRSCRPGRGSNCIHAVCDLDTEGGLFSTGAICGQAAAGLAVRHLSRWIINPDQLHDWLVDELELSSHAIERRR